MRVHIAFTRDYEPYFVRAEESLARFGVDAIPVPYIAPSWAGWTVRVLMRWRAVYDFVVRYGAGDSTALWVADADIVCMGDPGLIAKGLSGASVAAVQKTPAKRADMEWSAGLVGFDLSLEKRGLLALREFAARCEGEVVCVLKAGARAPATDTLVEQLVLREIMAEFPHLPLPIAYGARHEDIAEDDRVVFRHVPASRVMRAKIDALAQSGGGAA